MIRNMTLKDIDEVYALEKEIFKDPWTKDMFIQEVSDNSLASTYVLEEDNKIVGYAGMWKLFENADITNIAVKEEYRKKGYGKLLLETLLNECKKQNTEYVHLEVRVSNDSAINLYKSYGFEIINIRKGYYEDNHEDAYVMILDLGGYSEENTSN